MLSTSEIIKKYHLNTKKSLGQNFILDKNFTDKIVKSCDNIENCLILEIGAGPGSLTRSILDAKPNKLFAIEKDKRCIQALQELKNFYKSSLEIIEDDALRIDERKIFNNQKFKIIANLPYNIGTVLIFKWLKIIDVIDSMYLMLQKEVVERIVAKPNDKNYGRLAVMINYLCDTKMLFTVNKTVFTPQPKVTSAIIAIKPKKNINIETDFSILEKVVATAFNQRRKMIKTSLKPIFPDPEKILLKCNIKPDSRPEQLSIDDFCKISKYLTNK
jgi:16S rRNA (adenine1518-N6/adenine1519-N6)-dimethyltransferase